MSGVEIAEHQRRSEPSRLPIADICNKLAQSCREGPPLIGEILRAQFERLPVRCALGGVVPGVLIAGE
jgi:hypothetical protein